jgi:hypothetical protein
MKKRPRYALFLVALVGVFVIAATNSVFFAAQGGFGGGRGGLDRALLLLALPWVLIPWPEAVAVNDYLRLVGMPFVLNLSVVLVLAFLWSRRMR